MSDDSNTPEEVSEQLAADAGRVLDELESVIDVAAAGPRLALGELIEAIRSTLRNEPVQADNAKLREYVVHDSDCLLSQQCAFDPAKGVMYGRRWYPVDSPPPCTCGLGDLLKGTDHE